MMDGDLVVSADSTYWGRINAGIMDNLSTPDPSEPPNPAFCAFNVPCIWDGYDLGKGIPTVRFCYWRDQPWDNGYGATAPRPIDWAAPAARWR
jgi:hypothetical protein